MKIPVALDVSLGTPISRRRPKGSRNAGPVGESFKGPYHILKSIVELGRCKLDGVAMIYSRAAKVMLARVPMKLIHLVVTRGLDPRVHPLRMRMDCRQKGAHLARHNDVDSGQCQRHTL